MLPALRCAAANQAITARCLSRAQRSRTSRPHATSTGSSAWQRQPLAGRQRSATQRGRAGRLAYPLVCGRPRRPCRAGPSGSGGAAWRLGPPPRPSAGWSVMELRWWRSRGARAAARAYSEAPPGASLEITHFFSYFTGPSRASPRSAAARKTDGEPHSYNGHDAVVAELRVGRALLHPHTTGTNLEALPAFLQSLL